MGNSATNHDLPQPNLSKASITEVSLKIQTLKTLILQLNLCIDDLKHMPYVQEINNISMNLIEELLQNFLQFTSDIHALKNFLFPPLTQVCDKTQSQWSPFGEKDKLEECQKMALKSRKVQAIDEIRTVPQKLRICNNEQKGKKGAKDKSQFFSIIYEPFSEEQQEAHIQRIKPEKITECNQEAQEEIISQTEGTQSKCQEDRQKCDKQSQTDELLKESGQIVSEITDLKQQIIHFKQTIIELEQKNGDLIKRIFELEKIVKRLRQEKDQIQQKANELNDITLNISMSSRKFSDMIDEI